MSTLRGLIAELVGAIQQLIARLDNLSRSKTAITPAASTIAPPSVAETIVQGPTPRPKRIAAVHKWQLRPDCIQRIL